MRQQMKMVCIQRSSFNLWIICVKKKKVGYYCWHLSQSHQIMGPFGKRLGVVEQAALSHSWWYTKTQFVHALDTYLSCRCCGLLSNEGQGARSMCEHVWCECLFPHIYCLHTQYNYQLSLRNIPMSSCHSSVVNKTNKHPWGCGFNPWPSSVG